MPARPCTLIRWATCIIFAAAMTPAGLKAQQPDIATDHEIFAAYCSGVLTTQIGNASKDSQFPPTRRKWTQLARYRDYLAVRGVLSGQRSVAAIQGANLSAERGRQDQLACARQRDGCLDRCIAKTKGDMTEVSDCADICARAEPRCEQTARCLEPNLQFPF